MKIKNLLTESAFPTFKTDVKPDRVSLYGTIEGEKEIDVISCQVEWKFTFETKSWGVKNIEMQIIKLAIEFETETKTIEKVFDNSNCEFITEIDLESQLFVGDVEIDTSKGEDSAVLTIYNN